MKLVSAFPAMVKSFLAALRRNSSVAQTVVPQPQLIGVNGSRDTALRFDTDLSPLKSIGPIDDPSLVAFASDGYILFAIAATSLLRRALPGHPFKPLAAAPRSGFLTNSLVCYTDADGGRFLLMLTTAGSLLRYDGNGRAAGQNPADQNDPTFLRLTVTGQQSMALLPWGSSGRGVVLVLNPLTRDLIAYNLDKVDGLDSKPDYGPFDLALATRANLSPVSLAIGPDTNLYILMLDTTDALTPGGLTFWALGNTSRALGVDNLASLKLQPVQVDNAVNFQGIIGFAIGGVKRNPIIYAAVENGLQQIAVSPTGGDGAPQTFPATAEWQPGSFSAGALAYLTAYP